jgi:phosphatidylglycerophosphate synthase
VLLVLLGLAFALRATFSLSVAYLAKACVAYLAVALVTLVTIGDHHPFERFGPANQITSARAALVALVAGLIGEVLTPGAAWLAVTMALVAMIFDGADGRAARASGMMSAFGARFDMETDAALIQVLSILAWQAGKAGPWVILSGLLRYLFIAAGWIWSWMSAPLQPTLRAKAICVVQIAVLILVLFPVVLPPLSTALAAAGLLLLGYSFLVDTCWLWRQARPTVSGHAARTP